MSDSVVAERYARALFELADEAGQVSSVAAEMDRFAESYRSSTELERALANPAVDETSRDAVLKDLGLSLSLSPLSLNAIRLMTRRRRLGSISGVSKEIRRLADEKAGVLRATVTSARPLPESYYQRLAAELEKRLGKKIMIERKEDSSLIAGVVTRIGDNTIDGSVRGRLNALGRELLASN
jgi:F-type H+-transporting ATPase subunit delta